MLCNSDYHYEWGIREESLMSLKRILKLFSTDINGNRKKINFLAKLMEKANTISFHDHSYLETQIQLHKMDLITKRILISLLCFVHFFLTSNSRSCGSSSESGMTAILVILYTLWSPGNKPTSAFWRIRTRPRGKSKQRQRERKGCVMPKEVHTFFTPWPHISLLAGRESQPAPMSHTYEAHSHQDWWLHTQLNEV